MHTLLELPFFEPAHRELASGFGAWVDAQLRDEEPGEGQDGVAAARIFARLAEGGWMRRALARDAAGRLDLRGACLMRETLGRSSAMADVAFSEPWLAALPILMSGTDAQIERYLEPALDGRMLPAFALSEPGAGSDVAALACSARRRGDGWVLDGRKTWTSNAGQADVYVVFARVDGQPGAAGLATFLVEGSNPGLRCVERLRVMPPHSVGTLALDGCAVPADALLGAPGEGFAIAMAALEAFRPTVGAAALGFARRALQEATQRATQRSAFGKPIAEHQMTQAKLADMVVACEAAALCVYRAAWAADQGAATRSREAAIAKLFATEAAQRVVDEALQIFGGTGVLEGTTVERLYRHVRAFRIFDGSSEIQRLIIARHLLRGS